MKKLIILGYGEYGQKIGKIAAKTGKYEEIRYLDDKSGENITDTLANYVLYMDDETEFYPAFENNVQRLNWLNSMMSLGCNIATIIDMTSKISKTARIFTGCAVMGKADIKDDCLVKTGCIVEENAVIENNCVIEEGTHIFNGVRINPKQNIQRISDITK